MYVKKTLGFRSCMRADCPGDHFVQLWFFTNCEQRSVLMWWHTEVGCVKVRACRVAVLLAEARLCSPAMLCMLVAASVMVAG